MVWRHRVAAAAALLLAPQAVAGQPTGDVDAGREVYAATCAMCHGGDTTGMMGMHPALRGAIDRLSPEGVEVTIRNGRQPTPPMPAFGDQLSDEQIGDVIAYLERECQFIGVTGLAWKAELFARPEGTADDRHDWA